ncbi:response regulator transcription factor [Desulfatibacillum aliphaticivorans]|uniref:Two component transcriptional regulator, winged helix family n=1 Tax=Desulfatibacillum aliphaticivorans TaxID=218208 RepID=B8FGR7_DESAL|nr:response regulator transcription factor [Desulfatibacillum aliphaticivorans]ACL05297.1 two component transcriptional regulator, winged helix family [Desulfatibacillum aliphaticivorans]
MVLQDEASKRRILVVEDEAHIADGLKLNLELNGYEVEIAVDGVEALEKYRFWGPDLIVLDIMLPQIDGLSVLRNIRLNDQHIPILILSAKGAPEDKITGFSYGTDDYLSKPFNLQEFLLRVERLISRATKGTAPVSTETRELQVYRFGNNTVDFTTFSAVCQKGEVKLSDLEAKLLKLFFTNRGKPLSRKELLEMGWGYTGATSTRTVDNFIVRFRKYFEDNPKKPKYFKSLRSVGYIFDFE